METPSEKRTLLARIARGVAANGFAQIVSIIVSFVSVALFMRFWGIDLFGEWVILSAIPAYLTMSDFSFGTTAGSEMTMLVAQGKRTEALKVLQTAWVLVTLLSLAVLVVMLVAIHFVPLARMLNCSILTDREAVGILTVLLIGVCLSQQGGLIDAAFKCSGSYAQGIFLINLLRLIEFLCGVVVLLAKGDPWLFSWTMIIPRAICYVWFWAILRKKAPWLHLGWSYADKATMTPLIAPALTFNAFNLGYAFSLQGMVILVGTQNSPAAAGMFVPLRTLTRVIVQAASSIGNTMWVELSSAIAKSDFALARKLHRRASQVSFWIVVPSAVVFLFIGKPFFRIWTGKAFFDQGLFASLLAVSVVGSIWTVSNVVPLSINKHQSVSGVFLLTSAGALFLASLVIGPFGMFGASMALLAGEIVLVVFVVSRALTLVHDRLGPFLVQLMTPPVDLVMRALRRGRSSDSSSPADN